MTQTEVDERETARVEAILQVAKWALAEAVTEDTTTRCVHYLAGIQHDLVEAAEPGAREHRLRLVGTALDQLADDWDQLPDGERETVLAGIVGPGEPFRLSFDWQDLVRMAAELAQLRRAEPDMDLRTQRERAYAGQLHMITGWVVSA